MWWWARKPPTPKDSGALCCPEEDSPVIASEGADEKKTNLGSLSRDRGKCLVHRAPHSTTIYGMRGSSASWARWMWGPVRKQEEGLPEQAGAQGTALPHGWSSAAERVAMPRAWGTCRLYRGLSDVPSGGHLYAKLVETTRESCPVEPPQRV